MLTNEGDDGEQVVGVAIGGADRGVERLECERAAVRGGPIRLA